MSKTSTCATVFDNDSIAVLIKTRLGHGVVRLVAQSFGQMEDVCGTFINVRHKPQLHCWTAKLQAHDVIIND